MFCNQFDPLIYSIVKWRKWNFTEDEQDDVRQNIHLQLQSSLETFREESTLSWYIKRIAHRQCINEIRRQARWRTTIVSSVQQNRTGNWDEMEFIDPSPDPYSVTAENEQIGFLRSALQHLNQTCKDSIALYYLKHHSYLQMSEELGISVNTVGSRLSKCLDKLHEKLRQLPAFERTNK